MLLFIGLCFAASSGYLVNDLVDLKRDKQHPTKKFRPLASGELTVANGALILVVMAVCIFILSFASGFSLIISVGAYLASSVLYSTVAKKVPAFDLVLLSLLYVLRVLIGYSVVDAGISLYLLGFIFLFFLNLGLGKRFVESQHGDPSITREAYKNLNPNILMQSGVASGFASIVLLIIYSAVEGSVTTHSYKEVLVIWAAIISAWHLRFWFALAKDEKIWDPVTWALKDQTSWVMGLLVFATYFIGRL